MIATLERLFTFCSRKTITVNQKLAIRLLEKRGHQVVARGQWQTRPCRPSRRASYDLVLMDVQMPEMDGLEATEMLREREKRTGKHQPVVAMTALAMKGDRERCIAAGMDGYLSKPIRPQELDDVLDVLRGSENDRLRAGSGRLPRKLFHHTAELMERIDGDRAFLAELLELFREEYPGQIRAAREAVKRRRCRPAANRPLAQGRTGQSRRARLRRGWPGELESMGKSGDMCNWRCQVPELEQELDRRDRSP